MEEEIDDLKMEVRQLKSFLGEAEVKLQEMEDRLDTLQNEQDERRAAEKRTVEEGMA